MGPYRAFAAGFSAALGFIVEQVGGLDCHVDDVGVGEGEREVWKSVSDGRSVWVESEDHDERTFQRDLVINHPSHYDKANAAGVTRPRFPL